MRIKNFTQFIKENNGFQFNSMIDYTLLEESAKDVDIIQLCEKARLLVVKSVCVLPKHVSLAKEQLEGSDVLVCTVVSFPEGKDSLEEKKSETIKVISDGADEVDMVLNYHKLKDLSKEYKDSILNELVEEVSSLVNICHSHKNKIGEPVILKVIVESGLLTEDETQMATVVCLEADADFIKTSTGKVSVGAEMNKIKIMFDTIQSVRSSMKIKASGGVRTAEQINSMLGMVDRFGMGFGAVDKLNGLESSTMSGY